MEIPQHDFHSSVDTSRPFRSVKEAVAIFGERILVGEIYSSSSSFSPKPYNNNHVNAASNIFPMQEKTLKVQNDNIDNHVRDDDNVSSLQETTQKVQNDNDDIVDALKRVEAELEETKVELRQLKEREQKTEVAVASLNAELHKNMSRQAAKAATAAAAGGVTSGSNHVDRDQEERWRRELKRRMEKNTTLAQILSLGLGEKDTTMSSAHDFGKKNMLTKKKPIVPLVGDLFSRKKGSTTSRTTTKYVN